MNLNLFDLRGSISVPALRPTGQALIPRRLTPSALIPWRHPACARKLRLPVNRARWGGAERNLSELQALFSGLEAEPNISDLLISYQPPATSHQPSAIS